MSERLFVYGSLRSDLGALRPRRSEIAYALLAANAASEGQASVTGRLYAPAWYPGYVPGLDGDVLGEVWLLQNADFLAQLDAFEGDPYRREACEPRFADGRRVTAWTYCYAADLSGVPLIPSGDYLQWRRDRQNE